MKRKNEKDGECMVHLVPCPCLENDQAFRRDRAAERMRAERASDYRKEREKSGDGDECPFHGEQIVARREGPLNRFLSYSLKLLITGGLLWWVYRQLPIGEVWQALRSASPLLLGSGLIATTLLRLTAAYQTRLLTAQQGMTISAWRIWAVNYEAAFYALFVPGYVASSAVRWYRIAQPDGMRMQTAVVIVTYRILDTFVLVLTGFILYGLDANTEKPQIVGPAMVVLLVLLGGMYLLVFNRPFARFSFNMLDKIPLPSFIASRLHKLQGAAGQMHDLPPRTHALVLFYSFVKHLCTVASGVLLVASLDTNLSMMTSAWVRPSVFVLTMLPISFSGLGVREGALFYLLDFYHTQPAAIAAISILFFLPLILSGFIGAILETRRFLHK